MRTVDLLSSTDKIDSLFWGLGLILIPTFTCTEYICQAVFSKYSWLYDHVNLIAEADVQFHIVRTEIGMQIRSSCIYSNFCAKWIWQNIWWILKQSYMLTFNNKNTALLNTHVIRVVVGSPTSFGVVRAQQSLRRGRREQPHQLRVRQRTFLLPLPEHLRRPRERRC